MTTNFEDSSSTIMIEQQHQQQQQQHQQQQHHQQQQEQQDLPQDMRARSADEVAPPGSLASMGVHGCLSMMPQQQQLQQQQQQQSSPPPHSYRHSRSYRHFKNPPQPHMCIRTTTMDSGEELFINVLSWTRIVIPQEPSDPIPLYGGMRVPPGSPRSPAIVFAVMANPEVLKDSGRHSKDPEERRAMVELMCDFVEAMNPGVKLVRNAVILKDRDISGELKDVWNAVQAQRDREREEQIMQQRHQMQHFQNLTTQQLFPKTADPAKSAAATASAAVPEDAQVSAGAENGDATSAAAPPAPGAAPSPTSASAAVPPESQLSNGNAAAGDPGHATDNKAAVDAAATTQPQPPATATSPPLSPQAQQLDNKMIVDHPDLVAAASKQKQATEASAVKVNGDMCPNASTDTASKGGKTQSEPADTDSADQIDAKVNNLNSKNMPPEAAATNTATITVAAAAASSPVVVVAAPTPPTKKEKLGGFLPNGCIFPRFKNNRHKDKDKDKDKDKEKDASKPPKEKEKTLLNALKKSKDKKVAAVEQSTTTTTAPPNNPGDLLVSPKLDPSAVAVIEAKLPYDKNCLNLESEVEKLDLNKLDMVPATGGGGAAGDSIFIKLKSAAATTSS